LIIINHHHQNLNILIVINLQEPLSPSGTMMEDVTTEENSDQFIEISISEPQKVGEGMTSYLAYK
jgi:sorting nexin-1/2